MNKFDLMRLTGLDHGVDSALPQPWLDKMTRMGLNYGDALFWYAWQYQKSPSGPIHLGEALLNTKYVQLTEKFSNMIHSEQPDQQSICAVNIEQS